MCPLMSGLKFWKCNLWTPGRTTLAFVLITTMITGGLMFFIQQRAWSIRIPSIRVGVNSAAIASAPVFVADQETVKTEEKVRIDRIGFTSGKLALDALLNGSVDVATAAETPVILARDHRELRILATLAESQLGIVARRSKGITEAGDLRGKTIGVPEHTSADYFLQKFLEHNHIAPSEPTIKYFQPGDLIPTLVLGNVDAIAIWDPLLARAVSNLRSDAVSFLSGTIYKERFLLVSTVSTIEQKRRSLIVLINALLRARTQIIDSEDKAKDIVAREVSITRKELDALWSRFSFPVCLDNARLIPFFKEVDAWTAEIYKKTPRTVPELENMVDDSVLKAGRSYADLCHVKS